MRAMLIAAVAVVGTLGLARPAAADPAQIERGRQVFQAWCAACHGAGPGRPGTEALAARYHGSKPALLEERRDLTPEQVRFFARRGFNGMPFFRKTEIPDADLDAIGAYIARPR